MVEEKRFDGSDAKGATGAARATGMLRALRARAAASGAGRGACFASMFVRQVRQCFSVVWADGFPRCRHRFPVM